MMEIHGSRYVNLTEIQQTLERLRHRRIRAIVSRPFPLEGAEEAHDLCEGEKALFLTSSTIPLLAVEGVEEDVGGGRRNRLAASGIEAPIRGGSGWLTVCPQDP